MLPWSSNGMWLLSLARQALQAAGLLLSDYQPVGLG